MYYVPGHGFVGEPSIIQSGLGVSKQVLFTGLVLGGSAIAAVIYFYSTSSNSKQKNPHTPGVPGLKNLGNTCYANALLQGLASVPSVTQWLQDIDTKDESLIEGFLDELKTIILKLNENHRYSYHAGGVVSALIAHKWQIGIGVEHDLHELFNVFLTTGDDELRLARKKILGSSLLDIVSPCSVSSSPTLSNPRKGLIFERCAETVRVDARLRAPFFGLTATQLRCCDTSCGFRKVRYDSCSVISVQIPKVSAGRVTLECLLRKYFCMEVIRGATCDRCKERTGKLDSGLFKKQGFSKLPQCLVIRVERAAVMPSGNIYKISDHVEFGETLDVRDLCFYRNMEAEYERMMNRNKPSADNTRTPEMTSRIVGGAVHKDGAVGIKARPDTGLVVGGFGTIEGGSFVAESREAAKYRYQLRALSEHRGVPETGHFVTYRRGIHDQHAWYLTNDDEVTRVPYTQVQKAEAYMLYYERILPNRWHRSPSFSVMPLASP